METVRLNNGVEIPLIGFGTYQLPEATGPALLRTAIEQGYRHFDSAQEYRTEAMVGDAIRDSGLKREEVFVTTKSWMDGYQVTLDGIDESLARFGYDYFDLILIHWPQNQPIESYQALEKIYQAGKVRAIGVSNFNASQIDALLDQVTVKLVINQIETHLFWPQLRMAEYLHDHDIVHESWSPFGEQLLGQMVKVPLVQQLAHKYQVAPTQVLLRYLTQQKIVTIPMTTNPVHMRENLESLNFNLRASEIKSLRQYDRGSQSIQWPSWMRESNY